MRVETPQIIWHGGQRGKTDPVLSIDSHSNAVVASGGADAEVRLWKIKQNELGAEFLISLSGHENGVNVVRFSPDGMALATASDGGTVLIYRVSSKESWSILSDEKQVSRTLLRSTQSDIYDLCWSPDSNKLVTASIDHLVVIWEVKSKKMIQTFQDHTHFVQGVAWDPLDEMIATFSADRTCIIYQNNQVSFPKKQVIRHRTFGNGISSDSFNPTPHKSRNGNKKLNNLKINQIHKDEEKSSIEEKKIETYQKGAINEEPGNIIEDDENNMISSLDSSNIETTEETKNQEEKNEFESNAQSTGENINQSNEDEKIYRTKHFLFIDESVRSFFRRLTWSPDGSFLITPSGLFQETSQASSSYVTYLWLRHRLDRPALCIPCGQSPSVAVRCCPILFELYPSRASNSLPVCDWPYRILFVILTLNMVLLCDTQHWCPTVIAKGLHLANLTDVTWSHDGHSIWVSSTDGYISIFQFEPGELGQPYHHSAVYPLPPSSTRQQESSNLNLLSSSVEQQPKQIAENLNLVGKEIPKKVTATTATATTKKRITPILISELSHENP